MIAGDGLTIRANAGKSGFAPGPGNARGDTEGFKFRLAQEVSGAVECGGVFCLDFVVRDYDAAALSAVFTVEQGGRVKGGATPGEEVNDKSVWSVARDCGDALLYLVKAFGEGEKARLTQ